MKLESEAEMTSAQRSDMSMDTSISYSVEPAGSVTIPSHSASPTKNRDSLAKNLTTCVLDNNPGEEGLKVLGNLFPMLYFRVPGPGDLQSHSDHAMLRNLRAASHVEIQRRISKRWKVALNVGGNPTRTSKMPPYVHRGKTESMKTFVVCTKGASEDYFRNQRYKKDGWITTKNKKHSVHFCHCSMEHVADCGPRLGLASGSKASNCLCGKQNYDGVYAVHCYEPFGSLDGQRKLLKLLVSQGNVECIAVMHPFHRQRGDFLGEASYVVRNGVVHMNVNGDAKVYQHDAVRDFQTNNVRVEYNGYYLAVSEAKRWMIDGEHVQSLYIAKPVPVDTPRTRMLYSGVHELVLPPGWEHTVEGYSRIRDGLVINPEHYREASSLCVSVKKSKKTRARGIHMIRNMDLKRADDEYLIGLRDLVWARGATLEYQSEQDAKNGYVSIMQKQAEGESLSIFDRMVLGDYRPDFVKNSAILNLTTDYVLAKGTSAVSETLDGVEHVSAKFLGRQGAHAVRSAMAMDTAPAAEYVADTINVCNQAVNLAGRVTSNLVVRPAMDVATTATTAVTRHVLQRSAWLVGPPLRYGIGAAKALVNKSRGAVGYTKTVAQCVHGVLDRSVAEQRDELLEGGVQLP